MSRIGSDKPLLGWSIDGATGIPLLGRPLLDAPNAGEFAPTATLTPAMWTAREAAPGDTGVSTSGTLTVAPVNHIGRVWGRVTPLPINGGEWGYAAASAETGLDAGALGDAVTASLTIVALDATRQFLTFGTLPWVQIFYRALPTDPWLVASVPRFAQTVGRAATLTAADFTLEPYLLSASLVGLRSPRRDALSRVAALWWTAQADPVTLQTQAAKWIDAVVQAPDDGAGGLVDGAGHVYLDGAAAQGAPGATISNLRVVYRNAADRVSGISPAKSITLPTTPSAMTLSNAVLGDAARPTGDRLLLRVLSLPGDGGLPLTALEYEQSADGTTWSATQALPPQTGEYEITTTGVGVAGRARIRARNGLDPAPAWLTFDSVTPTTNSSPVSLTITPGSGGVVGQAVHGKVSPTSINALAAARGVSMDDFEAEAEWFWEFSVGNPVENYAFTGLPADHMGGTTAGWALGRFAAHVYATPGNHTARCSLYWRGALVGTGERIITIVERSYAVGNTGYWNPDGATAGADGVPVGANVFTSLNDAWTWVGGAPGRVLFLRRGKAGTLTVVGTPVQADMMIAAYDASGPHGTTGARPKITVDPGYNSARITAVGNGTEQVYTGKSLGANIYVYFDNALQAEGVGYTRGVDADSNKITATVPNGVTLRVFNQGSNGVLELKGNILVTGGGRDGAIIRDIEVDGQYDPANPGYFDNTDLSTANRFAEVNFIGSGSGTNSFITVFRSKINRFNCNMQIINPGNMIAAVDCNFDEWANYGFYISNCTRVISVGCSIMQNRMTYRGGTVSQSKGFNTPIQTSGSVEASWNAPWHGPMRCPYSVEQVINSCRMESRNTWAGKDALGAQPIVRLAASLRPGQNYSFTQCHTTGGWGIYNGGSANENITASRYGMAHVGYNVFVLYPGASKFAGGQIYVTSISNLYLVPAGTGDTGALNFFGFDSISPYIVADDVRQEPWRSINDSFLVLPGRANTLNINPSSTLASTGIQNLYSRTRFGAAPVSLGGYVVPPEAVGTATVRVPVKVAKLSNKPNYATRIWRGPDMPSATASATVMAQAAIYDFQYDGAALNYDEIPPDAALFIDVTLKSGTWATGDMVWISREQTVETAGTVEIDEDTGEEILIPGSGTPNTFFTNNRSVPLVRPPAQFHNSLVLMPTPWATVIRDDAAVTDMSPYLPASYGTFGAWWQPLAGNNAINAATAVRSAFDVRGRLRTGASLGALEPDTDMTGWPALPAVPVVTVALDPATYSAGASFGAGNVAATIVAAGAPALVAGDVVKTPEVYDSAYALVSDAGSGSLTEGQFVRGRAVWAHQTIPRQNQTTNFIGVSGSSFTPIWIDSNRDPAAVSGAAANGARSFISGLAAPGAGVNQHFAVRLRNHFTLPINGTARLWSVAAGAASGTPRLALDVAGALSLIDIATSNTALGTVPNTGGVASLLVSSYLAGDGPDGAGLRAWIKIDGGAVTPVTMTGPAKQFLGTAFRMFSATQGVANVAFRQAVGMWLGGVPTWDTFFEPSGEVRNWAADPSMGVPGMAQHYLLNGLGAVGVPGTFNGTKDGALPTARDWLEGAP